MRALTQTLTIIALVTLPSWALAQDEETERQKSSNFFEHDYVNKAMIHPPENSPPPPPAETQSQEENEPESPQEEPDRWEIEQ
jgi:hypothetical protein